MIDIKITRNIKDSIYHLRVTGHANFAKAGEDIVCSAVSAIVQTAVLGLIEVVDIEPIYKQRSGLADLQLPAGLSDGELKKTNIILETMLIGLRAVESAYGEYITIRERKVE